MDVDFIRRCIEYDPERGTFNWKIRTSSRVRVGDACGRINSHGYREIRIAGILYKAHKLAFVLMRHEVPAVVDHINGNRADNRWSNLRACSYAENQHNTRLRKSNTSGIKGLRWNEREERWKAEVCCKGARHTATFKSFEEGKSWVHKTRSELHGDFVNNG